MGLNRQFIVSMALAVLFTLPVSANDRWRSTIVPTVEEQNNQEKSEEAASDRVLKKAANLPTQGSSRMACTLGCETCGQDPCCCNALCQHQSGVFAEILFLRPGNVDVVYATEQTSFDPTLASPTGSIGRVNIDNGTGFRIGGAWALQDSASLVGTYTWLESDTEHTITAVPGNVLNLEVGHPSVATSGADSISASSTYDVDFQLVDIDYRALLGGSRDAALNYTVGLRYAHLTQEFGAAQEIFAGSGLTTVGSDIDFDGFGIRFGLDGMKRRAGTGLLLYANGHANFVGGEFKANFVQTNQFGGAAVIRNDFEDYRVVTILDGELGMGWESAGGRFRVSGGYLVSGWFNTLSTDSYINGVQAGSYGDLSETLSFDGLVGRIELRY